jgi:hypothetical protein
MVLMDTHELPARLVKKYEIQEDGCWLWVAAKDRGGYGVVRFNGKACRAHRVMYELLIGPIPDGLVIDHLCKVRACVNPVHMEPVTIAENTFRGTIYIRKAEWAASITHCPFGHPYDESNTDYQPHGRRCRQCHNRRERERQARRREERALLD